MKYNIDIDDYIGRWGVSKQFIKDELAKFQNKDVTVRINSLGGALDDGLSIRQQFVDHGRVTAYLFGFVASSATIAALGAGKTCISRYSMYLVHKVSNWVDAWGQMNADQIQEVIDQLLQNKLENDKIDLVLAQMYANKCKKSVNDILDVLKKGEWLTAQEALDYGFVDEIIEDGEKLNVDTAISEKLNRLGLPALPTASTEEGEKLFSSFLKWWKGGSHKENTLPPVPPVAETTLINITSMKKDFIRVNAILGIEGVEFENGKVALTEANIKALNDRLDALEADSVTKQTTIDNQKTQIDNLKGAPGGETIHVNGDEGGDDNKVTAASMYNDVKEFI